MNTTERDLLFRSYDHELTDAEQDALHQMLDVDQEARKLKTDEDAIRSLIANTRATSFGPGFRARVLNEIYDKQDPSVLRAVHFGFLRPRLLAAAASILVAVLLGWLVSISLTENSDVAVTVANATTETAILPDGSTVTLNAGSTISYPRSFVDDRTIRLNGEAFFDVVHDGSPFVVITQDASLTVLGTSFNVRAWSEIESRTIVTLHTGSIRIEDLDNRSVVLFPGERITIDGSVPAVQDTVSAAALSGTTSWRRGVVAFDREPFAFAMAELERLYNLQITLSDQALAGRKVTYLPGSREPIETVLSNICNAFSIRYRQTAGGFEILSVQ